jgi:phenylpyruvate tautomerase PptA (4-oxalocrotonate tautomerase family)
MAIVRVDYCLPLDSTQHQRLAASINTTMQTVLGVPPRENYVVCQRHEVDAILHAPDDCPRERRTELVFIQITLNQGRSPELKQQFFRTLTAAVAQSTPFRPENIFINLVEVARENWSFGITTL